MEGEDLKERLARGAIPVDEALEIAKQIAEALEEAHNKGIVHRDLKPANVKLTPEGKVKVLDFGLAKAWAGEASGVNSGSAALSQSPTLAHTGTIAGVILGTAAYMSPEQARGKPVDKRADVWSFGVLLWEMLTGRSLFAGDTVTDVIAAVVTKEPDLDALPRATPPAIRRLLARCLRKDPRTRLPDIGAARLEIQDVLAGRGAQGEAAGGDSGNAAEAERQGRRKERWAWVAVAILLGGVAATLAIAQLREAPPPRPPAGRFVVDAPDGWRFHFWGWPIVSPDGSQIVFRAVPETTPNDYQAEDPATVLWTRPLESLTARMLAGTERVELPFWSPDGQFVGFFAGGELRKLSLASGTIQRICALPRTDPDGRGLERRRHHRLRDVRREHRDPGCSRSRRRVASHDPSPRPPLRKAAPVAVHPQFLSGGRRVGFTGGGEGVPAGYYVATLDAPGEGRRLVDGLIRLQQRRPLRVLRAGEHPGRTALRRRGRGADRRRRSRSRRRWASTRGPPASGGSMSPPAARSPTCRTDRERRRPAHVARPEGDALGTVGAPGAYGQIVLSPDERNVAVETRDAKTRLRPVGHGHRARCPEPRDRRAGRRAKPRVVSGRPIAASSARCRRARPTCVARASARPSRRRCSRTHPGATTRRAGLADGKTLLFLRQPADGKQSVWALSPAGGEPEPVLNAGFYVDEPQLSPDGRWLAYTRASPSAPRCTWSPFGERASGCGCPSTAEDSRSGGATGRSCSSPAWAAG